MTARIARKDGTTVTMDDETTGVSTGATRSQGLETDEGFDAIVATPDAAVDTGYGSGTMSDGSLDDTTTSGESLGSTGTYNSELGVSSQAVGSTGSSTGYDGSGHADGGHADSGSNDRLQEATTHVTSRASDTAKRQLSGGMSKAGDSLDQVAQAVRQTGDQLREQQPQLANVATTAADQVQQVAQRLRNSQPDELIRDVESLARRQPVIFLGGAVLLGMAAARLLKASPQSGGGGGYGSGSGFTSGVRYGSGARYGSSEGYGATDAYGSGTGYDAGTGPVYGGGTRGVGQGGYADVTGQEPAVGYESGSTQDADRWSGTSDAGA
jgi:hypothetical protein